MENLLLGENIKMHFGGVKAVDGVDMHVCNNEILGVIGPNGSGKTTFFNALTGIYEPTDGKFTFKGQNITGKPLHEMVKLGIARTFQNLRIFRSLPVIDNVMIGQHTLIKTSLVDEIFRTPKFRKQEKEYREQAENVLEQVGLTHMTKELAGGMSYGMQKRLELARALVTDPQLLLLDEPTAGMNDVEAQELMDLVQRIKEERKISVILIEHNMNVMMKIAQRIFVLDVGKKIAEGTPDEIQHNQDVIRAYLGEDED